MSTKMARKQSKFIRYLQGPIWFLARARDLYLRSLTGCGGHISYGNAMGCPTPQIPSLPKSFSVNPHSNYRTAEEDLRELIRLASTRSLNGKIETDLRRTKSALPLRGGVASLPSSPLVAFARIDEDKPFELEEDENAGLLGKAYPKSRSYAVPIRRKLA